MCGFVWDRWKHDIEGGQSFYDVVYLRDVARPLFRVHVEKSELHVHWSVRYRLSMQEEQQKTSQNQDLIAKKNTFSPVWAYFIKIYLWKNLVNISNYIVIT